MARHRPEIVRSANLPATCSYAACWLRVVVPMAQVWLYGSRGWPRIAATKSLASTIRDRADARRGARLRGAEQVVPAGGTQQPHGQRLQPVGVVDGLDRGSGAGIWRPELPLSQH